MFRRLTVVCLLLLMWQTTNAATLYIDPATPTLNRGDAVTLSVRLDTDEAAGECINAIDGVITYNDAINPVDISVGESILPIWVEQPTIDKEKRQITFAGGIPNGYCGRVEGDPRLTNTILQLVFRAPGLTVGGGSDSNIGTVSFAPETRAYLNDGFGGEAILQTLGAELTLNQTVGNEIVDEWRDEVANDSIPPEDFSITLERDEFAFDKKYYIVFNTTDKQSGIDHYEVIEELPEDVRLFSFGAATAPWVETRSPHVLSDQSLQSTIRVRAVDKAGNEYVATLAPQNKSASLPWEYIVYGVSAFISLLTLGTIFFILRRRKQHKKEALVPAQNESTIIN